MKRIVIACVLFGLALPLAAQQIHYRIARRATIGWAQYAEPAVQALVIREADRKKQPRYAAETRPAPPPAVRRSPTLLPPHLVKAFQANTFELATPNDNSLAVSHRGEILSAVNSTVRIYDTAGQHLGMHTLTALGDTLQLPGLEFDPRVGYDTTRRRFLIVFLSGFRSSNSRLIVGFSADSSALGAWHFYALPGDPLQDSSWTDFPMIVMRDSVLIITANLLWNDSTWQKGFRRSVIWRVPVGRGFAGADSLDAFLSWGLTYEGKPLRNVCPVVPRAPADSFQYYLSNRNFAAASDSFFLIRQAPSGALSVIPFRAAGTYAAPPPAQMNNSQVLATNDARVLWAEQWHDRIFFAGNTDDGHGKATIYLGRYRTGDTSRAWWRVVPVVGYELGYPCVTAFPGNDGHRRLVFVNFSADTAHPGCGALMWSDTFVSDITVLQRGMASVNVLQSDTERWGDYTTCQPDPVDPRRMWCAGYVGKRVRRGLYAYDGHVTWIGAFEPATPPAGLRASSALPTPAVLMPQPVRDHARLRVRITRSGPYRAAIYDSHGRRVRVLFEDVLRAGVTYYFHILPKGLPAGTYYLQLSGPDGVRRIRWVHL